MKSREKFNLFGIFLFIIIISLRFHDFAAHALQILEFVL